MRGATLLRGNCAGACGYSEITEFDFSTSFDQPVCSHSTAGRSPLLLLDGVVHAHVHMLVSEGYRVIALILN